MTLDIMFRVVITGKLGLGGLGVVTKLPHANFVDYPFYWLCHVWKRLNEVI